MQKGIDDNTALRLVRPELTARFLAVRQRPSCGVNVFSGKRFLDQYAQCLAVQLGLSRRFGNDRLSHLAED